MNSDARNNSRGLSAAKPKILRARSLPSSRPFNVAALLSALHYLGLITAATATVVLFTESTHHIKLLAMKVILSGLAFSVIMWVLAFFKRRKAYCPLCKGTPMINSGARPHSKARRIFPLNHGVTATLSIIATQRFCCMYCGSHFDLLKTPSHLRGMNGDSESQ